MRYVLTVYNQNENVINLVESESKELCEIIYNFEKEHYPNYDWQIFDSVSEFYYQPVLVNDSVEWVRF